MAVWRRTFLTAVKESGAPLGSDVLVQQCTADHGLVRPAALSQNPDTCLASSCQRGEGLQSRPSAWKPWQPEWWWLVG